MLKVLTTSISSLSSCKTLCAPQNYSFNSIQLTYMYENYIFLQDNFTQLYSLKVSTSKVLQRNSEKNTMPHNFDYLYSLKCCMGRQGYVLLFLSLNTSSQIVFFSCVKFHHYLFSLLEAVLERHMDIKTDRQGDNYMLQIFRIKRIFS